MSDEQKTDAPVEEQKEEVAPAVEEKPVADDKPADEPASDASSDDEEVEVPKKFKSLVEEIEKMSVLDLAELVKILEKKFGVSAAAPAVAVAAAPGAGDAAAEEKTEFNVELTGFGENKISVIKVVKEITGLGLADAKGLVDNAPSMLKEGVKKEEAEEMKKKIVDAGGTVDLK